MRLSKIYTKTGDQGSTSLIGGVKVHKDDQRLESYGTLDELNSHVGMLRTVLKDMEERTSLNPLREELKVIQNKLFDLGSDLATPLDSPFKREDLVALEEVERVEQWIDRMNEELEPLSSFTLPGGGPVNAWAHLCRTVCRRAEREICRLHREEPVAPLVMKMVNRLSDYFFVLSRWTAKELNEEEFLWERPLRKD